MSRLDESLAARLYRHANAERWRVTTAAFAEALERSAHQATGGKASFDRARYLEALHLEDLALACGCAAGDEAAWDHFVLEYRPTLYRAADAIDPSGGARELADALYGELFGVTERGGARQSLFRYFHGRSSLATWLRAILTQRHVDRFRARRRLEPLPEEDSPASPASAPALLDGDRRDCEAMIQRALSDAVAALSPRDRLRLGCYYGQDMTLAAIGRLAGEHEATVSRHLTRTRRAIRDDIERRLRADHGLDDRSIAECLERVMADAGSIDLAEVLDGGGARKESRADRSSREGLS